MDCHFIGTGIARPQRRQTKAIEIDPSTIRSSECDLVLDRFVSASGVDSNSPTTCFVLNGRDDVSING